MHETLSRKLLKFTRGSGVVQVVESLPSKHEPQVQNPVTIKKTEKKIIIASSLNITSITFFFFCGTGV
jgi:hypothetical protein